MEGEDLTQRQLEMLVHAANGKRMQDTGDAMHLSFHTVRNQLDDARERSGTKTITECVVKAVARGEIAIEQDGNAVLVETATA